jgi:hypothetical protein
LIYGKHSDYNKKDTAAAPENNLEKIKKTDTGREDA